MQTRDTEKCEVFEFDAKLPVCRKAMSPDIQRYPETEV